MYKCVFEEAQKELRRVFGMQMIELPMREKVTVSQRRGEHRCAAHDFPREAPLTVR